MKFALFLGCTIPARLIQYESSSRAVLGELGVDLVDIGEFNCCGNPVRNLNFKAFLLASARNLALAESLNMDMMTLCKCCYGSLKKADHLMKENASIRGEINDALQKEGLSYGGGVEVTHLLYVLRKRLGLEAIKEKVSSTYRDLKIATHYGCHALRPSSVVQFDDPVAPALFDELVELTGAQSIPWATKLECCGAPVLGINDDLSVKIAEKKLRDARESGADYLCAACPFCHIQFDTVQKAIHREQAGDSHLPCILYPQLLGLSLGIDSETLGLGMNQIDIREIEGFLHGSTFHASHPRAKSP
jgi:heterodisulfide reductase subunit B